jgi:hypothetical protein
MGDAQVGAGRFGQGRDGGGHHIRQDARALAAADDQKAHRVVAGRDIGRPARSSTACAHRVAGVFARRPRRQVVGQVPQATGPPGGRKGGSRGPARRSVHGSSAAGAGWSPPPAPGSTDSRRSPPPPRAGRAACPRRPPAPLQCGTAPAPGSKPAARKGGRGHLFHPHHMRKAARIARAARIGGQLHPPAARTIASASACAGNMCPPVPPAAISRSGAAMPAPRRRRKMSPICPAAACASAPAACPPRSPPQSPRTRHS